MYAYMHLCMYVCVYVLAPRLPCVNAFVAWCSLCGLVLACLLAVLARCLACLLAYLLACLLDALACWLFFAYLLAPLAALPVLAVLD